MAARNPGSMVSPQQGEFHANKPRDEPLTTKGHKPGVLASEKDRAPEFSAETLPAGSAPASRTFKPNNISEVPPTEGNADASSTLGGATSSDVHTGLGHPGQGQTSNELRHNGEKHRNNPGRSLQGVGASGIEASTQQVNPHDPGFANQRGLDDETAAVNMPRGSRGGLAAQEREPETAEGVAADVGSRGHAGHATVKD